MPPARKPEASVTARSSTVNIMESLGKKVSGPFRRAFGELERMQPRKEGAEAQAEDMVAQIRSFVMGEISYLFKDVTVVFDGDAALPASGQCWLAGVNGRENLGHALPPVGVHFALVENARAKTAMIFFPLEDKAYVAEHGSGAHGQALRLRVAGRERLEGAAVAVSFGEDVDSKLVSDAVTRLLAAGARPVLSGNAVADMLAVAEGRLNGLIGLNLSSDVAAMGGLFLREAGGAWNTGTDAAPARHVAGNAKIKAALQEIF